MARPDELTDQIGDALRLARRRRRLSQRDLATVLSVSKSTLASLESGRGVAGLELVTRILDGAGFALELVDLEREVFDTDDAPTERRDAAGRRFPAHAEPRQITFPHHWWFVRHPGVPRRYWPRWTWSRGRPLMWPSKPAVNVWRPTDVRGGQAVRGRGPSAAGLLPSDRDLS